MIVVTGASSVALGPGDPPTLDPSGFLRSRKTRKFMGTQDDLAVIATAGALARAELTQGQLGERAGLFAVVGYIPFNREDIQPVLEASLDGGRFSMQRFTTGGFQRAHPLLTFRCLPNMPAYHVSANFDLQGPYAVSYPGPGQVYGALEQACAELDAGSIDVAVVVAVAHQRNFLVEHHFSRLIPPVPRSALWDSGACCVLERADVATQRGARSRARLLAIEQRYAVHEPITGQRGAVESFSGADRPAGERGPTLLLTVLAQQIAAQSAGEFEHKLLARDQISAYSRWQVLS